MLKFARWDAIVLEGASDTPVWISIVDDEVTLHDATGLWGLRTTDAQKAIIGTGGASPAARARPAVLTIGPAGERLSRIATIQHDAGCAFGQGGFGGVWGSKRLKAISVLGTQGVEVADPAAPHRGALLGGARVRLRRRRAAHPPVAGVRRLALRRPSRPPVGSLRRRRRGAAPGAGAAISTASRRRPASWEAPHTAGRRSSTSAGTATKHGAVTEVSGRAADLSDELGINAFEADSHARRTSTRCIGRARSGRRTEVHTDLPFDDIGELDFVEELLHRIAYRRGDRRRPGRRAAQGCRALGTPRRQTSRTGDSGCPVLGLPRSTSTRGPKPYWGYASIVTSRDVNCHDFNVAAYWLPTLDITHGREPLLSTAGEVAEIVASKTVPYCDPRMVDFSDDNLYSVHMARTTAWLLHYSLFWKQSCGLCDNAFADFLNPYGKDNRGLTPEGEMRFLEAVTGRGDWTSRGRMEIGRRILNLDRAIWALQGRHRDQEVFPEFVYTCDAHGRLARPRPGARPTTRRCSSRASGRTATSCHATSTATAWRRGRRCSTSSRAGTRRPADRRRRARGRLGLRQRPRRWRRPKRDSAGRALTSSRRAPASRSALCPGALRICPSA